MNDVLEKDPISYCASIYKYGKNLLNLLLTDKTTQKNIIWGTGDNPKSFLLLDNIFKDNVSVIKPRIFKSKEEQNFRIKKKAEVFTPI